MPEKLMVEVALLKMAVYSDYNCTKRKLVASPYYIRMALHTISRVLMFDLERLLVL